MIDWGFDFQLVHPNIPFTALKRRTTMPPLEEIHIKALEQGGKDSRCVKAIKLQIDCERYRKGRSFQQLFEEELGPKLHEIADKD